VPQWQAAQVPEAVLDHRSTKYFEIQNEARRTISQVLLGVFSVFAVFLAWRRAHNADGTLRIAEEGHITDRFTKAVEQLGASQDGRPTIEVRIGAIYALERISKDSPRDYWSVVDILAEYLCQHAKPENLQTTELRTFLNTSFIRADLAAVLRVLSRRRDPLPQFGTRLQLHNCFLPWTTIAADFSRTAMLNCDFSKDHFLRTDFSGSNFGRIDFRECGFHDVNFSRTLQTSVSFRGSSFDGCVFTEAVLSHIDFQGAVLRSVDFLGAKMTLVIVKGTDLTGTSGLTTEMLEGTLGDGETVLPKGVTPPKIWAAPSVFDTLPFLPPLDPKQNPSQS